jgi:hypothetical protein
MRGLLVAALLAGCSSPPAAPPPDLSADLQAPACPALPPYGSGGTLAPCPQLGFECTYSVARCGCQLGGGGMGWRCAPTGLCPETAPDGGACSVVGIECRYDPAGGPPICTCAAADKQWSCCASGCDGGT